MIKRLTILLTGILLPALPMMAQAEKVHQRSAELAQRDPHGWIMTLTAVAVVFAALILLAIAYNILGYYNGGKGAERIAARRKARAERKAARKARENSEMSPETAAAIALALDAMGGNETEAAIATALSLYLSDSVHDTESYVLTIRPQQSAWSQKGQNFRQLPK